MGVEATSPKEIGSLRELSIRLRWWIHGQLHQLRESLKTHMQENERGPSDYALDDAADRAVRRNLRARVEINNEGPRDGGPQSWQTWILVIVGLLIAAGIAGVITQLSSLNSKLAASLARQEMDEKRIDNLEKHVYRGSD